MQNPPTKTSPKLSDLRIAPESRDNAVRRGRWPWWAWLIGAVVVVGAVFWAWPRATVVDIARAQVPAGADGSAVLNASGYVVARRLATVSSEVTGRVTDVLVEEGMPVEAGQLLARIDDQLARSQLALAQSELQAANRSLQEADVRLAEAKRQLDRTRGLIADRLVSEAALDKAQSEYAAWQARASAAQSQAEVATRAVRLRREELAKLEIRAPFDGVVISKDAQPGEIISPISAGGGFTRTGLCTIVDMSSREIEVDVNEAYINRVFADQPVLAVLDAYQDWSIPGKVINIVPTADREKATVKVRIAFNELDPRILPDMGVKVQFLEQAVSDADSPAETVRAQIPAASVFDINGQYYVWRFEDDTVERRAISLRTGVDLSNKSKTVDVTAGLKGGDRVVVNPTAKLKDGMKVRISD